MKRSICVIALLLTLGQFASAQMVQHSLGIRYGAVYGLGTEVTYQRALNAAKRLEFDLGFNSNYEYINDLRQDYNSWALSGLYQWVWKLEKLGEPVRWYAGGGSRLGFWSSSQKYNSRFTNGMFLVIAGSTGIEYAFPEGIQFSLDARPELGLFNHGSGVNIGLSIRYQFR